MVSPQIQRRSIEQHAQKHGYSIDAWVEGIDESGSDRFSGWWPTLERAVCDVEFGKYDVLVVWKFSRIARNRLKWATAIHRVEVAGGQIQSATEDFDTTTSAGRLARGMLAELNAFMAEQIGETWKEAHQHRISRGLPHDGAPRWGYIYDRDQKVHRPDPITGPVLAEAYALFVAGHREEDIAARLNELEFLTNAVNPWTSVSLRRTLDTGFAFGLFRANGRMHRGIHEPLVSDTYTWTQYLEARIRWQNEYRRRRGATPYLFSGLVRCSLSGRAMYGLLRPGLKVIQYRCSGGGQNRSYVACPTGAVRDSIIEASVDEWLHAQPDTKEMRFVLRAWKVGDLAARRSAIRQVIGRIEVAHGRPRSTVTVLSVEQAMATAIFHYSRRHLRATPLPYSGQVDH